jgi:mannose PTS system EIIA component
MKATREEGVRSGVVIVAHGTYGRQLLEAAVTLVGPIGAEVVEVQPGEPRDATKQRVDDAAARQDHGAGVLLLVDICGSTPCNVSLEQMAAREGSAMATGLSLAMLMKLATSDPELTPAELADALHRSAQHSVQLGSDLLHKGAACGC